jgi:SMI1 / KNR4 family.
MEEKIKEYIDSCIDFIQKNKEYLMHIPHWEENIEEEMTVDRDLSLIEGKSPTVKVIQPERTAYIVNIISEKDKMWKAVNNVVSDKQVRELESELDIILPASYKAYLKYKHHYEIFRDLNVFLYPKPIHSWYNILLERNLANRQIIPDKDFLWIGRFSDYGEIALKVTGKENEEGEVVMFDYETGEIREVLAENFVSLLSSLLEMPEPRIEELKDWEKRIYK